MKEVQMKYAKGRRRGPTGRVKRQNETKVTERLRTRSISKEMINQEIDYQQVKIHQIWKKRQTKHEMP